MSEGEVETVYQRVGEGFVPVTVKLERGKVPDRKRNLVPRLEDGSSRLRQMMKEYARKNGGLWPYF